MSRLGCALLLGGFLLAGAPAEAKKRPPKASASAKKKKKEKQSPPPGDKSTNEGAQGRKNATEDAAGGAEGPNNSHGHGPY